MSRRLLALTCVMLSVATSPAEEARIFVPALLKPETRLAALQDYQTHAHPEDAKAYRWHDLQEFAKWHDRLVFARLQPAGEAPRFLLSWRSKEPAAAWPDERPPALAATALAPTGGTVLEPAATSYQIFAADGVPLLSLARVKEGVVADVDGDGQPEEIETWRREKHDFVHTAVCVRPASARREEPAFAILYNAHPDEAAPANTWGWHLRDLDGNATGGYELELGPVLLTGGIEPRARFRWDADSKEWKGPEPRRGDHFCVVPKGNLAEEVSKLTQPGRFSYPLAPAPTAQIARARGAAESDRIPPDVFSKPYSYQSLKGRSDAELFDYMNRGRDIGDYRAERMETATHVEGLWTMAAREAALAFVIAHRPPEIQTHHLLGIPDAPERAAPEEGDVSVHENEWYVHHLHCARAGSFVVYGESSSGTPSFIDSHGHADFRKVPISYEDARQILQMVWWVSRIRSRHVAGDETSGHDFPPYDDNAAVVLRAGNETVAAAGRVHTHAEHRMWSTARSEFLSGYSPEAFLSTCVHLFHTEVRPRLGAAFAEQAIAARRDAKYNYLAHTEEELRELKARCRELLALFEQGKVGPAVMSRVLEAIGNFGWRDLREHVTRNPARLPPLSPHEQRLARMDAELAKWRQKLGAAASARARAERASRRGASNPDAHAVLSSPAPEPAVPPPPGPPPRGLSDDEEAKFGPYDRLVEERDRLRFGGPPEVREIIEVREEAARTIRMLDAWDNPDALFALGQEEDPRLFFFAGTRLAEIDRPRAAELARVKAAEAPAGAAENLYTEIRKELEATAPGAPTPSEEQLAAALAAPRGSKWSYCDRRRAVELVARQADPQRFTGKAIDDALTAAFESEDGFEDFGQQLALVLARRRGPAAWEQILARGLRRKGAELQPFSEVLPALTVIAMAHGEKRQALENLLEPRIRERKHYVDDWLWSIWCADLQALKGLVERRATSGPEDYESTVETFRGEAAARCHMARHIAALWHEEDPLTRGKLLVAFTAAHARRLREPEVLAKLLGDLKAARAQLDPTALRALRDFAAWTEGKAASAGAPAVFDELRRRLAD